MTAPHTTEPAIGGGLVGREEAGPDYAPASGNPASSPLTLSMLADAIEAFVAAYREWGESMSRLMASAPAGDQDSRPERDEAR